MFSRYQYPVKQTTKHQGLHTLLLLTFFRFFNNFENHFIFNFFSTLQAVKCKSVTVESPLGDHPLLSGFPLLSGQKSKSQNNFRKEWEFKPLLSGHDGGHLLAIPTRVLPLLSPLLNGSQELDTLYPVEFGFFLRI